MAAKGGVTKGEVVFKIMPPVVDQQFFELFDAVPVPTVNNDTIVTTKPKNSTHHNQ